MLADTLNKTVSSLNLITHTHLDKVDRLVHARDLLLQDIHVLTTPLLDIPQLLLSKMQYKPSDQLKPDSMSTLTS
jgi:hypothetical protein